MQEKAKKVNAFSSSDTGVAEENSEKIKETTLYHSPDVVDEIADYKKLKRNRDEVIKDLLTNGRFTGYILTGLLKELKKMSIDDFCISAGVDPDTGGDLRKEATEFGTSISKTIRLDVMFEVNDEGEIELRINEEPQSLRYSYSENNTESYSLIGRGVYYAAMALAMEIQSEEEFHWLRKVYSIWICYERPIANVYEPILRYKMNPEYEYTYHKDGASISENRHKFDDGNLLSVIFISVPDLKLALNPGNRCKYKEDYDYEFLKGLYMILSGDVSMEDRKQFYFDSKIIKEEGLVENMRPLVLELDLDYANKIIEEQKTAIQRKNLKFAYNLLKMGQLDDLTQQESIDLIMEEVEVSYEEALALYNQLFQD